MSVPVFSRFAVTRNRSRWKTKRATIWKLRGATRALAARQSYPGVNGGLARVKALEAAEISSHSALESNKLGYQVGVRINIEVLNAQRQLYSNRRDLSRAR